MDRFSEYRIMWIFVFFDLPTETPKQRKAAADFRKELLRDGFNMFQYSIYLRHCPSMENAQMHIERAKLALPQYGEVGILAITDRQFGEIELYKECKPKKQAPPSLQLELF